MRLAFKMKVLPGQEEEYVRRHQPIWPDLESVLLEHGVRSYSIFLDPETLELLAYAEIEDLDRWQAIADTDVCRRWWASMAPLMEVNDDSSPRTTAFQEVFHIGCG